MIHPGGPQPRTSALELRDARRDERVGDGLHRRRGVLVDRLLQPLPLVVISVLVAFGIASPTATVAGERVRPPAGSHATDHARHDMPRPPDRCSYRSSPRDWPQAARTRACVRHRGGGLTVLLVGDSHAEHWAPALVRAARDRDWRLLSLTRARCMPYDFNAVRPQDHGAPTVGEICQG
jgi:hypothetical protein